MVVSFLTILARVKTARISRILDSKSEREKTPEKLTFKKLSMTVEYAKRIP